jgi:hypothetical protein
MLGTHDDIENFLSMEENFGMEYKMRITQDLSHLCVNSMVYINTSSTLKYRHQNDEGPTLSSSHECWNTDVLLTMNQFP